MDNPNTPLKTVQVLVRRKRTNTYCIKPDELYTPKQAADFLKISEKRMTDLRWLKRPPAYIKIGNGGKARVRYKGSDLLAYLRHYNNAEVKQ